MRKQATIPLETPVVPVNRRQVGKQLICRHSRIEKPKRNFDRPSIDHPLLTNERCSTSARCRFLLLLTHRRARSSRTNCLHSQLISEMCSHQEAPFKGQISTPSRAFALRFLSLSLSLSTVPFLFLPRALPDLSWCVPIHQSNFGDYINPKSILPSLCASPPLSHC